MLADAADEGIGSLRPDKPGVGRDHATLRGAIAIGRVERVEGLHQVVVPIRIARRPVDHLGERTGPHGWGVTTARKRTRASTGGSSSCTDT